MREFKGSNPCPEADNLDWRISRLFGPFKQKGLRNKHIFHSTGILYEVEGKDKHRFLLDTTRSIFPPYFHVLHIFISAKPYIHSSLGSLETCSDHSCI